MTSLSFNQSLALSLYQSDEPFPIDLDDAWQWLGYNQKSDALSVLKSNCEKGLDFSGSSLKSPTGGRPRQCIMLSIDCFKSLAMMAGTEQGKVIRRYFLECERIAKGAIANPTPQLPAANPAKLNDLIQDEARLRLDIKQLESALSDLRVNLQDNMQAQVNEAQTLRKANPELYKHYAHCNEILNKAKNDNPYLNIGSTKK
jgi:phage anti-repressor protein